jgi:hypothetical protein
MRTILGFLILPLLIGCKTNGVAVSPIPPQTPDVPVIMHSINFNLSSRETGIYLLFTLGTILSDKNLIGPESIVRLYFTSERAKADSADVISVDNVFGTKLKASLLDGVEGKTDTLLANKDYVYLNTSNEFSIPPGTSTIFYRFGFRFRAILGKGDESRRTIWLDQGLAWTR